jgi:hypothetical protein
MDCDGLLRGSINYLFAGVDVDKVNVDDIVSLACQAVWMKMIALSEVSGGRPGYIEDNNEKGLPLKFIANELHCPEYILKNVLKIMEKDGAVKMNGTGSIELINFNHYQFSEYDRQKPYRQAKKEAEQNPEKFVQGKYGKVVKR